MGMKTGTFVNEGPMLVRDKHGDNISDEGLI